MPVKAGVVRAGSRNTRRGAAETFTGVVFQDPVVVTEAPSRMGGSVVTFTPGARTAWHQHPRGQILYVVEGHGLVQQRGRPVEQIRAGDTIVTLPGEWHWHGAAPGAFMTHLAIQEVDNDRIDAYWGEHVTDQEYHDVPGRDR